MCNLYWFTQDWPTSSWSLCSEPGSAKPGGDRATFRRWYLRSGACVVLRGFQDFLMESLVWIYGWARLNLSKAIIGGWIWRRWLVVRCFWDSKNMSSHCHFVAETSIWLGAFRLETKRWQLRSYNVESWSWAQPVMYMACFQQLQKGQTSVKIIHSTVVLPRSS